MNDKINQLWKQIDFKTIRFYTENDKTPVLEFFQSMLKDGNDKKDLVKILEYLAQLSTEKHNLKFPYTRHVGDSVIELRPDKYRIFYGYILDDEIILLHYHIKGKSDQNKDIKIAQKRLRKVKISFD